jgi:hypothetical protein
MHGEPWIATTLPAWSAGLLSKAAVFSTIVTLAALLSAPSLRAEGITSDLTPAERAAVARMFESLGELVAADGVVPHEQQNRLVAQFLRSLGLASRAADQARGDEARGVHIDRLFASIGTLVELGEEAADSPQERRAAADLMRTIGSLVEADPDSKLSGKEAALISDLFGSMGDLIERGSHNDEAGRQFASKLLGSLAALIAGESL